MSARTPVLSRLGVLCLLAALTACKSEKNAVVYEPWPASTGEFPGAPATASALATDGKAFTEQGSRLTKQGDWNSVRIEAVGDFPRIRHPVTI